METPPAANDSSQLPRVLGPWIATAIVIGTVIGSGVFKKPHAVAKDISEFGLIMIAWVLVGALALIGSLILAEVAVIHPRAGGNYVFLREGYGRWAGFLWGWVEFWIIRTGSNGALAGVFSESVFDIAAYFVRTSPTDDPFPVADSKYFWLRQGVTVTVIAVLAVVIARGTIIGGGLQLLVTTVKCVSLVGIAIMPFLFLAFVSEPDVDAARLEPIWPADSGSINWSKFGSALVGILLGVSRLDESGPHGGGSQESQSQFAARLPDGTLAIIVLYLSVNVAYHLVVPRDEDHHEGRHESSRDTFAQHLLGPIGLLFVSMAIMISVFGSLNGNLLVGPRLLFRDGQDGLAPKSVPAPRDLPDARDR